jgi:hypothetical protein
MPITMPATMPISNTSTLTHIISDPITFDPLSSYFDSRGGK